MAKTDLIQSRLGEALARRGIRRIVYFHTDHFEPWRTFDGRAAVGPENADDLARFADAMQRIDFARRLTLFCKPHLNYGMRDGEDAIRAPGDQLGFYRRGEAEARSAKEAMGHLAATGHEFQLHVHHEGYTFNSTLANPDIKAYLHTQEGRAFDDARLTLGIRLGLDLLRAETGRPFDRWFFVHGHWALNASDANDCQVTREIEILLQEGCLGDFTFPAGRPHVNPRHQMPYLVRPNNAPKGYDLPEAEPEPAFGAGSAAAKKFFIWASRIKNDGCSIDYSSPFVRRRAENIEAAGLALIENSYLEDGTLFIKTHAHAMHPAYFEQSRSPVYPHQFPATQAMLGRIFDAGASHGAEIAFLTASEVYDEIISGPFRPAASLLAANAAQPAAVSTASRDKRPRGPGMPLSALSKAAPAPAALEEIGRAPLDERAARLNAIACDFILARIEAMGLLGSGCKAFYQQRALNNRVVESYEVELARRIAAAGLDRHGILEIGSGLGLFPLLLGLGGGWALGIERDSQRFAAAEQLLSRLEAAFPGLAGRVRTLRGRYPRSLPVHRGAGLVAVFLNFVATHAAAEQQALIEGLACHRAVILDTMRFFEHRDTVEQRAELVGRFVRAGFRLRQQRLLYAVSPKARGAPGRHPQGGRQPHAPCRQLGPSPHQEARQDGEISAVLALARRPAFSGRHEVGAGKAVAAADIARIHHQLGVLHDQRIVDFVVVGGD